jgi:hypothetical protein
MRRSSVASGVDAGIGKKVRVLFRREIDEPQFAQSSRREIWGVPPHSHYVR